ncbi:MAG: ABC transporter permease [Bacilli bacterium]
MKKKLIKNAFREVIRSKSRFLSIFLIIALGSGFISGLKASSPNMISSVEKYYDDYNLMDLNIKSQNLLTEDFIEELSNVDYIDYEFKKEVAVKLRNNNNELENVLIISINKNQVNKFNITKGRLPVNEHEVVIEDNENNNFKYEIGDEIIINSNLIDNEVFVVVGLVRNPMYLSNNRIVSNVPNFYIGMVEDNIVIPGYTDLYLKLNINYDAYSKEYKSYMSNLALELANNLNDKFVFTRFDNYGYQFYYDDAMKVDKIAYVIPIFFVLITLLVSLTTMMRMIDEQRIEIGTLFSLGYSKRNIWFKYYFYSMIPTFMGVIIGVILSIYIIPVVVYNAYRMSYLIPDLVLLFRWDYLLISLGVAILSTTLATTFSLYNLLREKPSSLLRPKEIKVGRKVIVERITFIWNRLSFNIKLTIRNLFRFKKRTLITIFGIAGCSALMLTGFGLRNAITSIESKQSNITINDGLVVFKTSENVSLLNDYDVNYLNINQSIIYINDKDDTVNLVVHKDGIDSYINFIDYKTKKKMLINDEDIIISSGIAQKYNIKTGDIIKVKDSYNNVFNINVTKIYENFTYNYIFINYDNMIEYHDSYSLNMSLFLTSNPKELKEELSKLDEVIMVTLTNDSLFVLSSSIENMAFIILIVILASGMLGLIVLYNLSNINITERNKELCTFKVLGLTNFEVNNYINRENYFCTFFGVGFGLLLGVYFVEYIINLIQTNEVMFNKNIDFLSYVYTVVLTYMFTFLVNFLLFFKVKNLDMIEAIKSVE